MIEPNKKISRLYHLLQNYDFTDLSMRFTHDRTFEGLDSNSRIKSQNQTLYDSLMSSFGLFSIYSNCLKLNIFFDTPLQYNFTLSLYSYPYIFGPPIIILFIEPPHSLFFPQKLSNFLVSTLDSSTKILSVSLRTNLLFVSSPEISSITPQHGNAKPF